MHGYHAGPKSPTTEQVLAHKHPDDLPGVAELIDRVRTHGVPFSSRHRIVAVSGAVRLVVVVGDPLLDDAGATVGTAGFYVDVTEQFHDDVQENLTAVLDTITRHRATINYAVGMLMLRFGITADEAFRLLASLSQQTNTKMRTIAERFVTRARRSGSLEDGGRLDQVLLTAHLRDPPV
jgi:hypothetical protein